MDRQPHEISPENKKAENNQAGNDQAETGRPADAPRHRRASAAHVALSWPAFLVTKRQRIMAAGAVVCVAVGATVALFLVGDDATTPPTPPRPVAQPDAPTVGAPASAPAKSRTPFHCGSAARNGIARPVRICIPSIHVDASVMRLGLNQDRTVQVPPLSKVGEAGWYKYSAQPGAVGPTVILGHVDSAQYGDGVFYHLSRLQHGDTVTVSRGDGRVAIFRIDRVQEVSKRHFPSQEVYGGTSGPAIRLVTCGGKFDPSTGSYLDNIIAYGTLASVSRTA